MKNITKTNSSKKPYSFTSWKIGDFVLQLLVVILGIVVTMVASSVIKNNEQQQQVTKALQLVKNEMNENLKTVDNIENIFQTEQDAARYIVRFRNNFSQADKDSLLNYSVTPFLSHIFNYTTDAFEMLKTSGLMQNIENKELILQIVKTYSVLGDLKEFHKWYRDAKEKFGDRINQDEQFTSTYELYYNRENVDRMWSVFMVKNDINNLINFVATGANFSSTTSEARNTLLKTISLIEQ